MFKLFGFLAFLMVLTGHTYSQPAKPAAAKPIVILAELTGTDSTNLRKEFLRCSHWQEWQQIWSTHREGKSPIDLHQMFKFNMNSQMVIAVFQGDCGYHGSVFFHSIEESEDHIRVRYIIDSVQTALGVTRTTIQPIRFEAGSYGFAVIPKCNKQIRFERGDRHLIADPYQWTEAAILPAVTE